MPGLLKRRMPAALLGNGAFGKRWFREGSSYPLEAVMSSGKTRAEPVVATLSLTPTREDDGALFHCVVWNRALPEGHQLKASVDLDVKCEYRLVIAIRIFQTDFA
ncbi:hypothetical protein EVAR_14965_1 [Eumeta japonica]|uniref:Ig-like domain-containing protein n=1 Tax=Eumeta variegata TaxID=151549 RepID=A0A4C1XRH6_EUMVA|nr:hypothetical protein EVAR_14965_1 [Eumeta japonica]